MLPGLWDGLTNTWDRITGKDKDSPSNTPDEVSNTPVSTDDLSNDQGLEEVAESKPVAMKVNWEDDLNVHLHALRLDAVTQAESRAMTAYKKSQSISEDMKTMSKLLDAINRNRNNDKKLGMDVKDDVTKALIKRARFLGVTVDEKKTKYSKSELDDLIASIQRQDKNLETDFRLQTGETQEAMSVRNQYYQELKSLGDKLHEAVKKHCQGIASR